jgi:hypothetical protein
MDNVFDNLPTSAECSPASVRDYPEARKPRKINEAMAAHRHDFLPSEGQFASVTR